MNHSKDKIRSIINNISSKDLAGREADFLHRVYCDGLEKYERRIKALKFTGKEYILDAGSGFGQWSAALSKYNEKVIAIEANKIRCNISDQINTKLDLRNIRVINGSIAELPFKNSRFDAIFCYSVIYQTDWNKALKELSRVLKPGGKIYITANSIGWSLYNILKNPNPSIDFNPRINSLKSLIKTISCNKVFKNIDWIIFPGKIIKTLAKLNFGNIILDGDGKINISSIEKIDSFYSKSFCGLLNVYEILAEKGSDE